MIRPRRCISCLAFLCLGISSLSALAADEPPSDWIDPATGHRVIRLSREPGTSSLYFHQNAYTDRGDILFVTIAAPRQGGGFGNTTLATIDLMALGTAPPKIEKVAEGFASVGHVVGKKTRSVYYTRFELIDGDRVGKVSATHLDTHETREIGKLPVGRGGSGLAINADETLLGGSFVDLPRNVPGSGPAEGDSPFFRSADSAKKGTVPGGQARGRGDRLASRVAQRLPMKLYTIDVKTGDVKTFAASTDWLNHVQFSPTDPKLMMFCHEGPWHEVDRVWTVRVDGGEPRLMHPRTMPYEIAGHEFFGFDGRTVWYDLQTPRSSKFWLAGVNLETGERTRYAVERGNWSVHYNQSHDGKLFAGDGGGPDSVANRTPLPNAKPLDPPGNGQGVFLFRPQDSFETLKVGNDAVRIGKFTVEKLVDLTKHNYKLEPNLTFSPDNKWIIFRSNMHGPTHVYAVEIAKAK
jgi:oligogalacturonide lyase